MLQNLSYGGKSTPNALNCRAVARCALLPLRSHARAYVKSDAGTNPCSASTLPTGRRSAVDLADRGTYADRRISTLWTNPIITAQATRCDPP